MQENNSPPRAVPKSLHNAYASLFFGGSLIRYWPIFPLTLVLLCVDEVDKSQMLPISIKKHIFWDKIFKNFEPIFRISDKRFSHFSNTLVAEKIGKIRIKNAIIFYYFMSRGCGIDSITLFNLLNSLIVFSQLESFRT